MSVKRLLALPVVAASLMLTSACGGSIYSAPPPGMVPGPALWMVGDADTTIYMFGTVHALPKDKPWFDQRIAAALASSDELVTEIDVSQGASSGQALADAGKLPEGESLRGLMDDASRRNYEAALIGLGLPVETLDRMEPWLAAMTLALLPLQRSGYTSDSGVELTLGTEAGAKKRGALESIDDQINLFDKMPLETQLAFLNETVSGVPLATASLDAMIGEWIKGDAQQLARLMNAELADPVLYDRLLVQRNANWAGWIDERLDTPGTVFVAVGAGHLAGKGSVQDLLKKRGIKVRRIWR